MRDLTAKDERLFGTRNATDEDALALVKSALHYLYSDSQRSMHDKVAGPFDYEELIAALIAARDALQAHVYGDQEPDPVDDED